MSLSQIIIGISQNELGLHSTLSSKSSVTTHFMVLDTLLHTPISMAKRPCSSLSQNPRPPLSQTDHLLHSFLSLADSPPSVLNSSFDRLLSSADEEESTLIDRALKLGGLLLDAANRSSRKRASVHNSITWALPPDLTIKVFSMLDTQSLCYAAAACSMFYKCAMDPLCYANIDLTTIVPKVNNLIVSTMIQRAGKALRSLKLGVVPGPTASLGSCQPLVYSIRNSVDASNFSWNEKKTRQGKESSILTRSCLNSLSADSGAAGALLRRLHLYNIERFDNMSLCQTLSSCPFLLDLEVVGLHVELRQTLAAVSANCHLIERLFFESSKTGRDDSLKSPTCIDFVNSCPNLSSLSLRGFKLQDYKVRILIKGLCKLKFADFSTSYSITGAFLKNLGSATGGSLLEVLILRDCMHLKEVEVARFLMSVLGGDFKLIRHIDISNREGLAANTDWYERCYNSSIIPLKQVKEVRPEICLVAEFPLEGSFVDMTDSDMNSELSLPSQLISPTFDGPFLMSSSESSYSSDQGSGNESQDSGFVIHEESSDEVDYLVV